jgi:hypothetical protein
MGKITVRDSLPTDEIFNEGLHIYFPRLSRKPTEVVPLQQAAVAPANAIEIAEGNRRLPDS